jgi:hypothetical protein
MSRVVGTVVSLAFLTFLFAGSSGVSMAAEKAVKTRGAKAPGATEQLKGQKNNAKTEVQAPPNKGGKKTRGPRCHLHVDNRTQWIIQLGVNGGYVGTVSAYGDAYGTFFNLSSGDYRLFGLAEFDDPSNNLTWGPITTSCPGGEFTWTLH